MSTENAFDPELFEEALAVLERRYLGFFFRETSSGLSYGFRIPGVDIYGTVFIDGDRIVAHLTEEGRPVLDSHHEMPVQDFADLLIRLTTEILEPPPRVIQPDEEVVLLTEDCLGDFTRLEAEAYEKRSKKKGEYIDYEPGKALEVFKDIIPDLVESEGTRWFRIIKGGEIGSIPKPRYIITKDWHIIAEIEEGRFHMYLPFLDPASTEDTSLGRLVDFMGIKRLFELVE